MEFPRSLIDLSSPDLCGDLDKGHWSVEGKLRQGLVAETGIARAGGRSGAADLRWGWRWSVAGRKELRLPLAAGRPPASHRGSIPRVDVFPRGIQMKLLGVVAEWLQKVMLWICVDKELPGPSEPLVLPQ